MKHESQLLPSVFLTGLFWFHFTLLGPSLMAQPAAENIEKSLSELCQTMVTLSDAYLNTTQTVSAEQVSPALQTDLMAFTEKVRRLRDVTLQLPRQFSSAEMFKIRRDPSSQKAIFADNIGALFDSMSKANLTDFEISEGDDGDEVNCCPEIKTSDPAVQKEIEFCRKLEPLVQEFNRSIGETQLQNTMQTNRAILLKFRTKLLDGFPAMPWEYVFNIHGTRFGPSPHQIIWLHPSTGLEMSIEDISDQNNPFQPVLTLQPLGYNYYFLNGAFKLKYIGLAAILTFNATKTTDTARYGALLHLGNFVSVGTTYGDSEWQLFLSSAQVMDKLMSLFY